MISIIILSYRNPALLRLCLKSLVQAKSEGESWEVIVVDNATSPETRNVALEEFGPILPGLKFIPLKENSGYTHGVNVGLRAATGQHILALNHDIVMVPGTVEALATYLTEHSQVGLLGPRLANFDDTHQASCFRYYRAWTPLYRRLPPLPLVRRHLNYFAMRGLDLTRAQEVDWVSGAAFMTTRAALDQIGYLDENLFHYFSDVDWARRFWENGYSVVYYPMAALYHYLGRASKGRFGLLDPLFNRATRWHIQDGLKYFLKHGLSGILGHRPNFRVS